MFPYTECKSVSKNFDKCGYLILLQEGVGGGVGGQIILPRESLVLYKSFNTLWDKSTVLFSTFFKPSKQSKTFVPLLYGSPFALA